MPRLLVWIITRYRIFKHYIKSSVTDLKAGCKQRSWCSLDLNKELLVLTCSDSSFSTEMSVFQGDGKADVDHTPDSGRWGAFRETLKQTVNDTQHTYSLAARIQTSL